MRRGCELKYASSAWIRLGHVHRPSLGAMQLLFRWNAHNAAAHLDNVRLEATSIVPESGAALLLALGLVGLSRSNCRDGGSRQPSAAHFAHPLFSSPVR